MFLNILTFATMNWKSAPMTHIHSAGNENVQYESPYLCTAARRNAITYAAAPIPIRSLLLTLCWIKAATRFASRPKTTMGSM